MKVRLSRRAILGFAVALFLTPQLARANNIAEDAAKKAPASVIRVAPPAPAFDEQLRLNELASRRARVGAQLGKSAMLILFSGLPRVYTNDVDYPFRSENNFFYLTNLRQQGSTLVLLPGEAPDAPRAVLFLPRRRPAAETWTGHMYSPEEARQISGVNEIYENTEFINFMRAARERATYAPSKEKILLSASNGSVAFDFAKIFGAAGEKSASAIYLLLPPERGAADGESREYPQEHAFAAAWSEKDTGVALKDASSVFAELRLRKSPLELQLLQHAIDISIEGHERAQAIAARAQWEYEVSAEVDYTFKRRNADNWGYPNIVGCGTNATTLHYEEVQGRVTPGQLLLMDVGAEYGHYSADITRTFPVNGKFTKEQADIYNIVLAAQDAGMRAVKVGGSIEDVQKAATQVIKDGLLKLGLITDLNSNQYRRWFMHGASHWLGMNVHDVGNYGVRLEPGMVFTVEPGIYIRPDALDNIPKTPENEAFINAVRPAFEKYKGIGVRIEDDVLVTPEGFKNLSGALPRSIPDIENFIKNASREMRGRS